MSNMINNKARFAVEDTTGRVFCYLTNRYYAPTGTLVAPDGTWDLAKVKAAIESGGSIYGAITAAAKPAPVDKVQQANADFSSTVDQARTPMVQPKG